MINQHIQAEIAERQEFIHDRPDAREVRKALAVKLVYQGYKYEEIQTILDMSLGSITSWKHISWDWIKSTFHSFLACINYYQISRIFG